MNDLSVDDINQHLLEIMQRKMTDKKNIHPRNIMQPNILEFSIYVQPVIFLVSFILLAVLHYLLWGPKFFHKYGYMSVYTIIDLTNLFLQSAILIITTFQNDDYIIYGMCYPFIIFTLVTPYALYFCSQWVKVIQAFHRFLIVHFPMSYRDYFVKKMIILALISVVFISIVLCSLSAMATARPESVIIFDHSSNKLVDVCRFSQTPLVSVSENEITQPVSTALFVLGEVIPASLMLFFCLGLIRKLRVQDRFRKQFSQNGDSDATKESERLSVIVSITTFFYIISTIPRFFEMIYTQFSQSYTCAVCERGGMSYIFIIDKIFKCVTPTATFFLFCWLSVSFRNLCKNMLPRFK